MARSQALRHGRYRWAVHSEKWSPEGGATGSEFQFLLSLIPDAEERKKVMKYVFLPDKKRALISRLLCRRAAAEVLGVSSYEELDIPRTKGQKPFLRKPRPPPEQRHLANWNFNVSHEGDWVVLASEPLCVCGVDVAAPHAARHGNTDLERDFADQLTREELQELRAQAALEDPSVPKGVRGYATFQKFWSAKEAFVKARGDGIVFPLKRCGFHFLKSKGGRAGATTGVLKLDGTVEPRWAFVQEPLGADHYVTVARGPTDDVQDQDGQFRSTLLRPTASFNHASWYEELHRESPPFREVPVSFLVPGDSIGGYREIAGHLEDSQAHEGCHPEDAATGADLAGDMPPRPCRWSLITAAVVLVAAALGASRIRM